MNSSVGICLRVPNDFAELLWQVADSQGASLGSFVRQAVVAYADASPDIDAELATQLREAAARIRSRPSKRALATPAAGEG